MCHVCRVPIAGRSIAVLIGNPERFFEGEVLDEAKTLMALNYLNIDAFQLGT